MTDFSADKWCFVCGADNPIGFCQEFFEDDDGYYTTVVFKREHQGYMGIVHGGLTATLLDEVMARLVWEKAGPAATARIEVNYRKPIETGIPIRFTAKISNIRREGKIYETIGKAILPDGTVAADAVATVVCVKR